MSYMVSPACGAHRRHNHRLTSRSLKVSFSARKNTIHTKIAAAAAAAFVLAQGAVAQDEPSVADQILTRPSSDLTENAVQAIFAVHGASEIHSIPQLNVRVLQVPAEKRDVVLNALQHNPNIEFAEVNGRASPAALTNDIYVACGYEWQLNKIQAGDAWGITSGRSEEHTSELQSRL